LQLNIFSTGPHQCLTNPCKNGGTCLTVGVKDHVCKCPTGYSGTACEQSTTKKETEILN